MDQYWIVSDHQKQNQKRSSSDAVYSDHALDLRVTCMFLCRASSSLRSQVRRYNGDALDI